MTNQDQHQRDPFAGFFASIVLALMVSNFLAGHLVNLVFVHVPYLTPDVWKADIAAGLFIGIVLADPVGTLFQGRSLRTGLIKFVVGFALGVLVQISIVGPMAGDAMSRYVFLILAALLLPVIFVLESFKDYLRERNSSFGEVVSEWSLMVMGLPDRLITVVVMGICFVGFRNFGNGISTTLVTLLMVLVATTLFVAFADDDNVENDEEEEDIWLAMEERETEVLPITAIATARFKKLLFTIIPGAIVLGGVTHLALDVLLYIYPNVTASIAEPKDAARVAGMVAASGLGVVVFGMAAALGFALASLLLIGRIGNWNPAYIRERCFWLVRVMCLTPAPKHTGSAAA